MNHRLLSTMTNTHESHTQLRKVDSGEGIWVLLLMTLFLALI